MAEWRNLFRGTAHDAGSDREIGFHIESLTEANISRGMPADEARRQAMLEFGGREQVRQKLREIYSSATLESVAFHVRAAMRFVRSSPSLSIAVILTLALGIGSNSAVFSAIDKILLRPLPFPNGDELVVLYQHDRQTGMPITLWHPRVLRTGTG